MSAKKQMQAVSGDQNQRALVTGVRGELAVTIDVGEAQAPGEVLSRSGFPRDLESGSSSIPPRHGAIGLVFQDPASGLPVLSAHCGRHAQY